VAHALDDAGVVFENNSSTAPAEALPGRCRDQGAGVRPSSPPAKKTQRRPGSDA
jgi:hypothetical protein